MFFVPVWLFTCILKESDPLKAFSHIRHLCGLELECVFLCLHNVVLFLNLVSHLEHWYGTSPAWMVLWTSKLYNMFVENPHVLQENGFLSEWTFWWFFKVWIKPKYWPQMSHSSQFFSSWILLCLFIRN